MGLLSFKNITPVRAATNSAAPKSVDATPPFDVQDEPEPASDRLTPGASSLFFKRKLIASAETPQSEPENLENLAPHEDKGPFPSLSHFSRAEWEAAEASHPDCFIAEVRSNTQAALLITPKSSLTSFDCDLFNRTIIMLPSSGKKYPPKNSGFRAALINLSGQVAYVWLREDHPNIDWLAGMELEMRKSANSSSEPGF